MVIDRQFLGFAGERLTNRRLIKMKDACSKRIVTDLLPVFGKRLRARLRREKNWKLEAAGAEDDPDLQTLLFRYPTEFADLRAM